MSAAFHSHCIPFHHMEKNTLHLAASMSQLKRLKSTSNDIKTFSKTDRGCLAWCTLVYLPFLMCVSCVHPQIMMIQHLYPKSSFWCASLLMKFMSTRYANTMAKKLFWFSAGLSLELVTISKCPRAHHSHGCWVSFTPIFIRHCKVTRFCFHLLIIISCNIQPSLPSLLSTVLLNSHTEHFGMLPLKNTVSLGDAPGRWNHFGILKFCAAFESHFNLLLTAVMCSEIAR